MKKYPAADNYVVLQEGLWTASPKRHLPTKLVLQSYGLTSPKSLPTIRNHWHGVASVANAAPAHLVSIDLFLGLKNVLAYKKSPNCQIAKSYPYEVILGPDPLGD